MSNLSFQMRAKKNWTATRKEQLFCHGLAIGHPNSRDLKRTLVLSWEINISVLSKLHIQVHNPSRVYAKKEATEAGIRKASTLRRNIFVVLSLPHST